MPVRFDTSSIRPSKPSSMLTFTRSARPAVSTGTNMLRGSLKAERS